MAHESDVSTSPQLSWCGNTRQGDWVQHSGRGCSAKRSAFAAVYTTDGSVRLLFTHTRKNSIYFSDLKTFKDLAHVDSQKNPLCFFSLFLSLCTRWWQPKLQPPIGVPYTAYDSDAHLQLFFCLCDTEIQDADNYNIHKYDPICHSYLFNYFLHNVESPRTSPEHTDAAEAGCVHTHQLRRLKRTLGYLLMIFLGVK